MNTPYRETQDLDEALAAQAIEAADVGSRLALAEKLLDEVSACFTRDDDLPDGLLPRITEFLKPSAQAQGSEFHAGAGA